MSTLRSTGLAVVAASLLGCPQQQEEAGAKAAGPTVAVGAAAPDRATNLDLRPHGLALVVAVPSTAQVSRMALDEKEAAADATSLIVVKAPDLTLSLFPFGDRSREQVIKLSGEGSVEGEGSTEAGRWVVTTSGAKSTFLLWNERLGLVCRVENFVRPKLKDALKICSSLSAP